jgi:hypothetical protein
MRVISEKDPLTPALSREGRGSPLAAAERAFPSPHPHPLADAEAKIGKLGKPSLLGEGTGVRGIS